MSRRRRYGNRRASSRSFGALTADVRELCERLGIGEPALVLEGGYDLVALAGSAAEIAAAYSATRRT